MPSDSNNNQIKNKKSGLISKLKQKMQGEMGVLTDMDMDKFGQSEDDKELDTEEARLAGEQGALTEEDAKLIRLKLRPRAQRP